MTTNTVWKLIRHGQAMPAGPRLLRCRTLGKGEVDLPIVGSYSAKHRIWRALHDERAGVLKPIYPIAYADIPAWDIAGIKCVDEVPAPPTAATLPKIGPVRTAEPPPAPPRPVEPPRVAAPPTKSPGAIRQQRWRERLKASQTVTK